MGNLKNCLPVVNIDLPDNCNYYRDNKGIIPIIRMGNF